MKKILHGALSLSLLSLMAVSVHGQDRTPLARAEYFDAGQLEQRSPTLTILPHFEKNGDAFWYTAKHAGSKAADYYMVDPDRMQCVRLTDRLKVSGMLQKKVNEEVDTLQLHFSFPDQIKDRYIRFSYKDKNYAFFWEQDTIMEKELPSYSPSSYISIPSGQRSPDGKWVLYARGYNLYVHAVGEKDGRKLTTDGEAYYSFASQDSEMQQDYEAVPDAYWVGTSGYFYAIRKDKRKIGTMHVLNSLTHPRPIVNTYKYELPGDTDVQVDELYIGHISRDTLQKIDVSKWKGQTVQIIRTPDIEHTVYFIRKNRTRNKQELCKVDVLTGEVRVLIEDSSHPFINEDLFSARIIKGGKEILWWSDRTGWGHFYRYSGEGELLNALTAGEWTAGELLKTDTATGCFYFYGYGRERGFNPNYSLIYKADLDGSNMRLLSPENANHSAYFSPSGKFFVDNFSRIDLEPNTVVRSHLGKKLMHLYRPSLDSLYAYGWKRPEMFIVKAKDGVTDLYGIMWKPFDFDPTKRYPVISQVYPGPQTETVWSDFTVLDRYNNTSLAQLGAIVVCMGHRGGSPYRNSTYYKYGYGNLRDYALEDDKYGIQQLAQQFPFIDTARVGITGHSGGGMMALAALGTYPDFYKAAVSSSGNHDNRIYNRTWGETYQGIKEVVDSLTGEVSFVFKTDINQSLAKNIKGALLLVAGESDVNVNPAATMRMTDALIRENKQFDLLILPGQSHTYEGLYKKYYQRRQWQFFLDNLIER